MPSLILPATLSMTTAVKVDQPQPLARPTWQASLKEVQASHDNLEKDVLVLNDKLERSIKEQSKVNESYK